MKTFLKGLWIGGTMTVPGVSGGTMAAVIGIYEDLIIAIADWRKDPKKYLLFLMKFVAGAGIGFLSFARLVTYLLEQPTISLVLRLIFCMIVLGSIPFLVRQSGLSKIAFRDVVAVLAGAAVVYGLSFIPTGLFEQGEGIHYIILQLIGGFIVAIALILPGISVSHMLYILGLYQPVMEKVYSLQFVSLIPLAIGVLLGCILTTHFMKYLLDHYKKTVYMTIIGFVAVSVVTLITK